MKWKNFAEKQLQFNKDVYEALQAQQNFNKEIRKIFKTLIAKGVIFDEDLENFK